MKLVIPLLLVANVAFTQTPTPTVTMTPSPTPTAMPEGRIVFPKQGPYWVYNGDVVETANEYYSASLTRLGVATFESQDGTIIEDSVIGGWVNPQGGGVLEYQGDWLPNENQSILAIRQTATIADILTLPNGMADLEYTAHWDGISKRYIFDATLGVVLGAKPQGDSYPFFGGHEFSFSLEPGEELRALASATDTIGVPISETSEVIAYYLGVFDANGTLHEKILPPVGGKANGAEVIGEFHFVEGQAFFAFPNDWQELVWVDPTITLDPVTSTYWADTYTSAFNKSNTFGASVNLLVGDTTANEENALWFQFDINQYLDDQGVITADIVIDGVTVAFTVNPNTTGSIVDVGDISQPNTTWLGTVLTWNNQPAVTYINDAASVANGWFSVTGVKELRTDTGNNWADEWQEYARDSGTSYQKGFKFGFPTDSDSTNDLSYINSIEDSTTSDRPYIQISYTEATPTNTPTPTHTPTPLFKNPLKDSGLTITGTPPPDYGLTTFQVSELTQDAGVVLDASYNLTWTNTNLGSTESASGDVSVNSASVQSASETIYYVTDTPSIPYRGAQLKVYDKTRGASDPVTIDVQTSWLVSATPVSATTTLTNPNKNTNSPFYVARVPAEDATGFEKVEINVVYTSPKYGESQTATGATTSVLRSDDITDLVLGFTTSSDQHEHDYVFSATDGETGGSLVTESPYALNLLSSQAADLDALQTTLIEEERNTDQVPTSGLAFSDGAYTMHPNINVNLVGISAYSLDGNFPSNYVISLNEIDSSGLETQLTTTNATATISLDNSVFSHNWVMVLPSHTLSNQQKLMLNVIDNAARPHLVSRNISLLATTEIEIPSALTESVFRSVIDESTQFVRNVVLGDSVYDVRYRITADSTDITIVGTTYTFSNGDIVGSARYRDGTTVYKLFLPSSYGEDSAVVVDAAPDTILDGSSITDYTFELIPGVIE